MHDPLTVAFDIPRPWPERSSLPATGGKDSVRWRIRLHHTHVPGCENDPPHKDGAFPWWKPGSYSSFWRLAGRDFYWPPLVTVWHREPGGRDSGSVCKHFRRVEGEDGPTFKVTSRWRWHIHHWRIQVPPLQALRRWALTRCEWCEGRSRKGDLVNNSHQWDRAGGPWWRGERGLFHRDCSSVERAHKLCYCADPLLDHDGHGRCATCGGFRAYKQEPTDADRMLRTLAKGQRIPVDMKPHLERVWAELRAAREASDVEDPA
jgi:hypothetical protein